MPRFILKNLKDIKMKTAVEWIEDNLNNRLFHLTNNKIHIKEFVRTAKCAEIRKILELINQAKEMEKEQIKFFFEKGHLYSGCPYGFDEIYNKTFKSE